MDTKRQVLLLASTLLLAVSMFIGLVACSEKHEQERVQHFESLKELFENPSKEYRSAPLWVWNTDVKESDIDRMLGELKYAGFGGAFIHPRPGMITEYLSDEWFRLYKYSVEKGKELGLDIWIYDENSYPSGFAGGHVNVAMPESYNQGQGLIFQKVRQLPDNANNYFLCLKKDGDTFLDITAQLDKYKGVEGEYYLYTKTYYGRSSWHGGYSYVDLLYPGVTEKFIEVTMSGYEKTFGQELGTVIKGVFSDEPNINTSGGIRWTPDLFDVFRQKWGYDLKEYLPLLVEETGDWMRVRHNYMEVLTQLFIDRWAKPMHDYCESKNLKWTGHYWEHDWPNMANGGDNMAMYAWHQLPAIDMLFNQFNDSHPQAQFGNVRAVKELRSVANQMGITRTLSETYGGGGWDETFEDFKRLGDWEYALGVNFMNQHLSHMTITGARKYDYPPVFTSLSPWWADYKTQNDYFARLSLVLSHGEQLNDILVLEPTTTAWLYFSYLVGHAKTMEVGVQFQNFVTRLEKNQVEYDLGSENIIKDFGSVGHDQFIVGKRSYGKVVLPPMMENLNKETFRLLQDFVSGGGELIAFSVPVYLDGMRSDELDKFFHQNADKITIYEDLSEDVLEKSFRNDKIRFSNVIGNQLYHQRRSYKDGELLFLVNSSLTESAKGHLSLSGKNLVELDAMSGKMFTYQSRQSGDYRETDFILPPAGSLLLFCSVSGNTDYPLKPQPVKGNVLEPSSTLQVQRIKDNVLTLDFCDLVIDGKEEKNLYVVEACNRLYGHFGMSNPWNSAVQYKRSIVEKDTFHTGNIQVVYHFNVKGDVPVIGMKLVVEQPDVWKVRINGQPVASEGASFLDSRWGTYPVGSFVKEGENTVELSVNPMSIYAEIAPVYLFGDFSLDSAPAGWTVREPVELDLGSWKTQGIPCYSWDVAYRKDYQIPDTNARYALQLHEWKGTVAEVFVNGNKAGIIAYQPYQLDLTPYLQVGCNTIEIRVIGGLRNLFGPHYNQDKGIMGPWHWNGVQKQLPGNEYNQSDYGLMEDFTIIQSE